LKVALWVLIVAAALAVGAAAGAQDARIPVRVDSQTPEACASSQAFLEELVTRDPNVRAATAEERAPRLVVRIARTPKGTARGRLVVEDTDGTLSRREVDGDTCESVLGALALMAAIAVDPRAPLSGPLSPAVPKEADADASSRASTDGSDLRTSRPDSERRATPPVLGRTEAGTEASVDRAPTSGAGQSAGENPRVSFAGGAGVTSGTAPAVVPMIFASAAVTWGRETRIGPVLRGGFEHEGSGDDAAPGGGARFVLNAGTLDLCARLPLTGRLEVLPCFRTEGGSLAATGLDIFPARSDTRPWIALGALGTARYRAVSVVFAEVSAGLLLPLVRDRYYFEPDTTVFHPPPLAAFASAGLGVTIP
jgi:hypothetical protein